MTNCDCYYQEHFVSMSIHKQYSVYRPTVSYMNHLLPAIDVTFCKKMKEWKFAYQNTDMFIFLCLNYVSITIYNSCVSAQVSHFEHIEKVDLDYYSDTLTSWPIVILCRNNSGLPKQSNIRDTFASVNILVIITYSI